MKTTNSTHPTSPLVRAVMYFGLFTFGVIAFEIIRHLTPLRSSLTLTLIFATVGITALIGGFFTSERNLLSRVISISVTLILGFIGVLFGSLAIYMLLLAIAVSYLGARPLFHNSSRNKLQNIVFSILSLLITGLFIFALVYGSHALWVAMPPSRL